MSSTKNLTVINRGERLIHRFKSFGMNSIFGFFNEIHYAFIRKVGENGQRQEAEGTV